MQDKEEGDQTKSHPKRKQKREVGERQTDTERERRRKKEYGPTPFQMPYEFSTVSPVQKVFKGKKSRWEERGDRWGEKMSLTTGWQQEKLREERASGHIKGSVLTLHPPKEAIWSFYEGRVVLGGLEEFM